MKRILNRVLFIILLIVIINFKNNVMAATIEIWNGSCGDINHSYEFYKIFDKIGDGKETAYQYKTTDKWKNFFAIEGSDGLAIIDENGIVTEFGSGLRINEAAVIALEYVKDNSITFDLKPIVACTEEDKTVVELDEGYYLIKSPRGNLGTLIEATQNSQINEKNFDSIPILYFGNDVRNNLTYGSIGDEIVYHAEAVIRGGTTNAYVEILNSPGITIDPSTIHIDSTDFDSSFFSSFVFKTTNLKNENGVAGLEVPKAALDSMSSSGARIMFTFTGKLNENTKFSNNDTTNVNDATVKIYFGDGRETEASISIISWKYTINTFYKDNTDAIDIPNVHYSLSKTNDKENLELYNFVKVSDGVYRLALDREENTTTDLVNTAGKSIVIEGLNNGTYYLIQNSRPAGFGKVYDPTEIKLEVQNNSNGRKLNTDTLNIELAKESMVLPMTGGSGTTLLITLSLISFIITFSIIITKIRIKNK